MSPLEAERQRIKGRERVWLYNLKKRAAAKGFSTLVHNPNEIKFAYETPQALGNVVHKVTLHLPHSPSKRKAVVCKLVKSTGLSLKGEKQQSCSKDNKKIDESTVQCIEKFYFPDLISCQAPGRHDFVIVTQHGKKTKLQKRHLLWSIKETFGLFQKEFPSIKIGLSKFSSLWPVYVLLQSSMPRDVCLCMYHESVKNLCDCLNKEISSFLPYSGSFVNQFVCDSGKEGCMIGKCTRCRCPNWLEDIREDAPLDELVKWSHWERVTNSMVTK